MLRPGIEPSNRLLLHLDLAPQTLIKQGESIAEFTLRPGSTPQGITWDDANFMGEFHGDYRDAVWIELFVTPHTLPNARKRLTIQYSNTPAIADSWGAEQIVFFELGEYQGKYVPMEGSPGRFVRLMFDIGNNAPNAEDVIWGNLNGIVYNPETVQDAIGSIKQPVAISEVTVTNTITALVDDYSWNITLDGDTDYEVPTVLQVILYKSVLGRLTRVNSQNITAGLALGATIPAVFTALPGAENGNAVSYEIETIAL